MNNPEIDEWRTKRWFDDLGRLHRENGPAVEYLNGDFSWYVSGVRHRLDGPAVKLGDDLYWFYHNKQILGIYSQKEFERWLKLRIFL